jgi:hypothetical protein
MDPSILPYPFGIRQMSLLGSSSKLQDLPRDSARQGREGDSSHGSLYVTVGFPHFTAEKGPAKRIVFCVF